MGGGAYHLHSSLKLGDLILRCRDHKNCVWSKRKNDCTKGGRDGEGNPERDERLTSSSSSLKFGSLTSDVAA